MQSSKHLRSWISSYTVKIKIGHGGMYVSLQALLLKVWLDTAWELFRNWQGEQDSLPQEAEQS